MNHSLSSLISAYKKEDSGNHVYKTTCLWLKIRYRYLQKVTINNIFSLFEIILSGESSVLSPILLNIFLPHLFLWLKISDSHNFADDNTIAGTCNDLTGLCQTLEKKSESTIDWFKNNSMISNIDKFKAIVLSKDATDVTHKLTIYDNEIETTKLY